MGSIEKTPDDSNSLAPGDCPGARLESIAQPNSRITASVYYCVLVSLTLGLRAGLREGAAQWRWLQRTSARRVEDTRARLHVFMMFIYWVMAVMARKGMCCHVAINMTT